MLNSYISKLIILAQVASDGGKRIRELLSVEEVQESMPFPSWYWRRGYNVKDSLLKSAIKAICKNKKSGFLFYVKKDFTFSNMCYLVYFNFKVNGVAHQVSFHTFGDFSRYENEACATRWKKKISSRDSVVLLCENIKNKRRKYK